MIEVLLGPRDLVFVHVLPTGPADGISPHLWEIFVERHNTNVSAEITHLFPAHHPHDDIDELDDYLARAPLELQRTPLPTVQQVLAQATRTRGPNPSPRLLSAYRPEVLRTYLRPYMHDQDSSTLDIEQVEVDWRIRTDPDDDQGPAHARVQALITSYRDQYAQEDA